MTHPDTALAASNDARGQLAAAIQAAYATCDRWPDLDFPNLLADALVAVTVDLGDVGALIRHHPDSREAAAVRQLIVGAQDLIDDRHGRG